MASRIKPKLILDAEMLEMINEFYSARLGEEVIGLECFSDPKLNAHICNIQALSENEQPCEYCKNVFGRQCKVTCHIHYFCLAVFAYRLGIGEKKRAKLSTMIKHNLNTLSYKKLYGLVMEILEKERESEEESLLPADDVQMDLGLTESSTPKKKRTRKKKKGPVYDEEGNELITITDAAKIYGCTYVNMYSHVRRGNVQKVIKDGMNFVRKKDVEEFRDRKKPDGGEG